MTHAPDRRALVKRLARWAISALAIAFVIWMLPFRDRCTDRGCEDGLLTTFRRTNLPLLGALFTVYLAGSVAWAARWRGLLRLADVHLSLRAAWRVTLEAQAGGILLPGGVGGDALRIAFVKDRVPEAALTKIVASIMADRIVGLVTLATLALGLGLVFDAGRSLALPVLAGIPAGAAALWLLIRHPGLRGTRLVQSKLGARLVQPFLEYAAASGGPRALGYGFLMSLLVSAAQLVVVRGLVATVGVAPASEGACIVGCTFAMIVAALPISPGAWGTAEAAYVFFLAPVGIPPPAAAAVCLLFRLMWYVMGSMGAVSAFARGERT